MIKSISIKGFKSFRDVSLELGPLNLFIGANASGKSNFFDALRVLQGIGLGLTVGEIFDGKPRSSRSEAWEGIRGGRSNACFKPIHGKKQASIQMTVTLKEALYSMALDPLRGWVIQEKFEVDGSPVFDSEPANNSDSSARFRVRYHRGSKGKPTNLEFERARPVLQQFAETDVDSEAHNLAAIDCLEALGDMQYVDPSPDVLRRYSPGLSAERIGEKGENFAAVVKGIIDDKEALSAYTSWLKRLTPAEVDQVIVRSGAVGDSMFAIAVGRRKFPAPVLSDGTLRFAAMTAAFFQSNKPGVLLIEEIENGIHPTRIRLLVELLKSQARFPRPQVMATTHSPVVLAWLEEEDYAHTFLCTNNEETGESIMTPLSKVPRFLDLSRKYHADDLFTEGWLETAL